MNASRRRVPAEERRRQILAAALEVFAQSNFKRARVADIAALVGVTEAAIYRHFPTKKSIYIELLDHIHGRVLAFWKKEATRADVRDPIDALHAMGRAYDRRIVKHRDELKVQFQAIAEADDPEISARLRSHHRQYRSFVAALIEKGVAEGSVRAGVDPQTIGHLFDAAGVFSSMMRILADRSPTRAQYEKMADQLLEPLRS